MLRHGLWTLLACSAVANSAVAQGAAAEAPRPLPKIAAPAVAPTIAAADDARTAPPLQGVAFDACAPACGPCSWAGGEYLFWWLRGNPTPPLATLGSTADPIPGAIGQPGTRVIFDDTVSYPPTHGGRATVGGWINDDRTWGWEASGFVLERQASQLSFIDPSFTDPTLILTVPAVAPVGPVGLAALDAIFIDSSIQVWSAEANILRNLRRRDNWSLDGFIGFRYFDVDESLNLLYPLLGAVFTNGFDNFRAQNYFYSGQLGAKLNWRCDRLSLDLVGKCAFGSNHRVLTVSGIDTRDGVQTDVGVFFAEPTNVGRHTDDTFAILPEAQIKVGYDLTSRLRATAGYNFLYMTNVLRAGGGVDTTVGSPGRPAPRFDDSSFWAHGVSLGVEVRW